MLGLLLLLVSLVTSQAYHLIPKHSYCRHAKSENAKSGSISSNGLINIGPATINIHMQQPTEVTPEEDKCNCGKLDVNSQYGQKDSHILNNLFADFMTNSLGYSEHKNIDYVTIPLLGEQVEINSADGLSFGDQIPNQSLYNLKPNILKGDPFFDFFLSGKFDIVGDKNKEGQKIQKLLVEPKVSSLKIFEMQPPIDLKNIENKNDQQNIKLAPSEIENEVNILNEVSDYSMSPDWIINDKEKKFDNRVLEKAIKKIEMQQKTKKIGA